jgi:hypothetical protein
MSRRLNSARRRVFKCRFELDSDRRKTATRSNIKAQGRAAHPGRVGQRFHGVLGMFLWIVEPRWGSRGPRFTGAMSLFLGCAARPQALLSNPVGVGRLHLERPPEEQIYDR